MKINLKNKIYNFDNIFFKEKNCHIFFISLLALHYIIPLALFGKITLFYHDVLDSGVVYNHVLGQFYRGETNPFDYFLGGSLKSYYFKSLLKPYSLIYGIFNTELAYWITDFLIKITSYFSFFILSRKLVSNFFLSSLVACVYAYFNSNALGGFGTAIFPYLIYLVLFKETINLKHYIIIIFFGINTDLVGSLLLFPIFIIFIYLFDNQIVTQKKNLIFKITFTFYISMFLTSLNMFFVFFSQEDFHRDFFLKSNPDFFENLYLHLASLIKIKLQFSWPFIKNIPYSILILPILLFSVISQNKKIRRIVFCIFGYFILSFIFDLKIFESLKTLFSFIKSYRFNWIEIYLPFLQIFLLLLLLNEKKYRTFLVIMSFVSIFLFQIHASIIPMYKDIRSTTNSIKYNNIYTFKGYYSKDNYLEIKKIVKNDRVLSVGLDPMVAIMNNIKTIDGYHNLYPNEYKTKFRRIIKKELLKNQILLKYYDNWGSRVYAFVSDPNNIEIDFDAVKYIGGKYIVSKYPINNNYKLKEECKNCKTELYLYKIK